MRPDNQLKRRLTLPLLSLYGLGTILGAGIYVLVGEVAGIAGMYAPVAFLVSALLAALTGISYAELCTRYPRSAGEAIYVNKAFGVPLLSATVGWAVIATGVVSAATLTRGFVGYLGVFMDIGSGLAISLTIIAITLVACWGILESVSIAAVITAIEIAGLILVIFALRDHLHISANEWQTLLPPVDGGIWLSILLGAFLAFYAFIGFEDMVNVVEEVVHPQRTMPMAIMLAISVSSLFYILIAMVAVLASDIESLAASASPMVDLIQDPFPTLAKAVGVISLIAIVNGALIQVIMGARMLYGMSHQKLLPATFMKVSARTGTPIISTVIIGGIVGVLALGFPLVTLAKITSFIIILVFAAVNFSLATIRYREAQGMVHTNKQIQSIFLPSLTGLLCLGLLMLELVTQ